jgi:hypothetical protein
MRTITKQVIKLIPESMIVILTLMKVVAAKAAAEMMLAVLERRDKNILFQDGGLLN